MRLRLLMAGAAGARRTQAMLVSTEGASNRRMSRRALDLLHPDVFDFFRFTMHGRQQVRRLHSADHIY